MKQIAVVDFGMGNLHSVLEALSLAVKDTAQIVEVRDGTGVDNADKVVFPGQGAASDCMKSLDSGGLADAIRRAVKEKPFLGICMGMQVLFERSEESDGTDCLGVFKGGVTRFPNEMPEGKKVPHMGWNRVRQCAEHPLWEKIDDDSHFYFAHSYYPIPADDAIISARTTHGNEFACAVASGFVFAVQFHPEKSAVDGFSLLRNFCRWEGGS